MRNDVELIFEQYLQVLDESKKQIGVRGTRGVMRPDYIQRKEDTIKELRVKEDEKNNKVFNVLELMSEFYKGGMSQAKADITKYMGDESTRSVLNPLETSNSYEIPLFNLPNRLLSIRALKTPDSSDSKYQNFLEKADNALSKLYKQQTGGNPDDINELKMITSHMSRIVNLSKNAGETPRQVLQRARVAGYTEDDPKYVHITTLKEDHPRLFQYIELLFGFDVREEDKPEISEADRQKEVEERVKKQVQKYAWELTKQGISGERFKELVQKYRADLASQNEPNAITVSELTPPQPAAKKPAAKKPAAKKPAAKKPEDKKPEAKKPEDKKVNKESYFIKLMPF